MKAVKPGLAMVTISVGGKHSHFEVEVREQRISVESVTLPAELADGVTLKLGATLDIAGKATITPSNATDKTESYNSSNPMIASVTEEGIVSAIAVGEATITISVDGQSAQFTLTVEKIAVESVTLPEELAKGVTLAIGDTFGIAGKATIAPENASFKTETYTSSKPEVASISDAGEIKALTEGETTITVEADGIKATFSVKVEKGAVLITSIAFPESSKEVELGEPEAELDLQTLLTILPAEHTEGIVFTSSDPSVATVSENGKVTCLKAGETTVTARTNEKTVECKVTVKAKEGSSDSSSDSSSSESASDSSSSESTESSGENPDGGENSTENGGQE